MLLLEEAPLKLNPAVDVVLGKAEELDDGRRLPLRLPPSDEEEEEGFLVSRW
jgi:hypothetical protein